MADRRLVVLAVAAVLALAGCGAGRVGQGSRLAVVNAKFDTGLPPTAASYEVVTVDGR